MLKAVGNAFIYQYLFSRMRIPGDYPPLSLWLKYSAENSTLIADLTKLSKKSPKLVKSSEHAAPADPNVKIRSWKMNEFKYYDIPSPFPTLARGLFTMELPKENEKDIDEERKYRIVVRGYDKFFNIGEVPWTHVRSFLDLILNIN